MTRPSTALAVVLLTLALGASPQARAQAYSPDPPPSSAQPATMAPGAVAAPPPIAWDAKRLERLERSVRKLEGVLTRLEPKKAPPQLVEPDPDLVALQGRADDFDKRIQDLESALKKVNAALEQQGFDLDAVKKDAATAHADADALRARVAALETQVKALTPPPAAAPGPDGAPAPAAGAAPADSGAAFQAAMKTMRDGDYAGAGAAFQAYLNRWPDGAEAPEAHYRLAETLYVGDDQKGAALEYLKALKGWPKTPWAADGTVKLAMALQNLGRSHDACTAAAEFYKRYASGASAAVKARAAALKSKAKCRAA